LWVEALAFDDVDDRPPGMYKAVSGMKKSPSDQGELSGILQKLGYDKEQVLVLLKMMLIVGLQILGSW